MGLDASKIHARLPAFPEVPAEQCGEGTLEVRYEDVSQDGRLGARPATHAIGAALWRGVLERHPMAPALLAEGIVPILARIVVVVGGGPIGVRAPLRARGAFDLVETQDASGKTRFRADLWANIAGVAARTFGPPPEREGTEIALGAVWAEHVLTRPFAPPETRTVERLPAGLQVSRRERHRAAHETVELPEGARWLDADWAEDPAPIVFGLGHTDSNQHVNSLVYPHLLEDAALRRIHALGMGTKLFVTRMEMAYRKPSFAGDVLSLRVRAYERAGVLGVVGAFAAPLDQEVGLERARAFGALEFEP